MITNNFDNKDIKCEYRERNLYVFIWKWSHFWFFRIWKIKVLAEFFVQTILDLKLAFPENYKIPKCTKQ